MTMINVVRSNLEALVARNSSPESRPASPVDINGVSAFFIRVNTATENPFDQSFFHFMQQIQLKRKLYLCFLFFLTYASTARSDILCRCKFHEATLKVERNCNSMVVWSMPVLLIYSDEAMQNSYGIGHLKKIGPIENIAKVDTIYRVLIGPLQESPAEERAIFDKCFPCWEF